MRSCSSTIRRRVRAFGAAIGAGEEVVFATELDRPDGALDGIDQFKHVGTTKALGRLRVGRRLAELSGKQRDTKTRRTARRNSWRPAAWLGLQEPAAAAPSWWRACASGAPSRPTRELLLDPSADLQDPRRGERHRFSSHPRARRVFRGRGRALLHRAARSGFDADLADRGLRPECGVTRHRDVLRSLQPDGGTRVLGYTREVGDGGVTYFALGHCHNPTIRAGPDRRSLGHDAAHFSRLNGKAPIRCVAAQNDRLGCGRRIAAGGLRPQPVKVHEQPRQPPAFAAPSRGQAPRERRITFTRHSAAQRRASLRRPRRTRPAPTPCHPMITRTAESCHAPLYNYGANQTLRPPSREDRSSPHHR